MTTDSIVEDLECGTYTVLSCLLYIVVEIGGVYFVVTETKVRNS